MSAASRRAGAASMIRAEREAVDPVKACQYRFMGCLGSARGDADRDWCRSAYAACLSAAGAPLRGRGPALGRVDPQLGIGFGLLGLAVGLPLVVLLTRRARTGTWSSTSAGSTAPRLPARYAQYQRLFDLSYAAAAREGVPPLWMIAIAMSEGWPSWTVVNASGHYGMWQFSQGTARMYGWTGTMEQFRDDPEGQARTMATALADYVRRARTRCAREPDLQLMGAMHHDGMGVCGPTRPETPLYLGWVADHAAEVQSMLSAAV